MKPQPKLTEGPTAFANFQNAMRKVLKVSKEDLLRREAQYKAQADLNPNKLIEQPAVFSEQGYEGDHRRAAARKISATP